MLVPKKNRLAIYSFLFKEGVMVAPKNYEIKHAQVEVPNLHVIKLMTSLKSRGYVREQFSWQWFYWALTNEGIEYLREYLHVPADTVPNTLKKSKTPQPPPSFGPSAADAVVAVVVAVVAVAATAMATEATKAKVPPLASGLNLGTVAAVAAVAAVVAVVAVAASAVVAPLLKAPPWLWHCLSGAFSAPLAMLLLSPVSRKQFQGLRWLHVMSNTSQQNPPRAFSEQKVGNSS
eukprot:CAMPEP_0175102958 /NCGR_PEP_ID=MMETSP0086_2-20121207/8769_1 /TAXON_ID=136419 /ORGANISM="Unknown Unknown, Strain D1" /LENGTH=232 /DNA_ID=CAMNT_0016377913 /DNA_START=26 /DNA_END=725 /DNA_ORIENTATION=-